MMAVITFGGHGPLASFADGGERTTARRGCAERWYYWYTGDPVGMAYFVTSKELITSSGVDVRELGTGEQWYEAQPEDVSGLRAPPPVWEHDPDTDDAHGSAREGQRSVRARPRKQQRRVHRADQCTLNGSQQHESFGIGERADQFEFDPGTEHVAGPTDFGQELDT